jgi:hypothetical protein
VTQPLDRTASIPRLGEVDSEAGEFWIENPFQIAASGMNLSAFERNCLFLNIDGESFVDASFSSVADIDSDSRSVIAADFDRDGTSDLLVRSDGGGPLRLFLNRIPDRGHSVRFKLQGTTSNRPAIGARFVAKVGEQQIVRDLFPPNGFMGQGPTELLLGLGESKQIDELSVRWPTGNVQHFKDIPVESVISITEGQAEFSAAPYD